MHGSLMEQSRYGGGFSSNLTVHDAAWVTSHCDRNHMKLHTTFATLCKGVTLRVGFALPPTAALTFLGSMRGPVRKTLPCHICRLQWPSGMLYDYLEVPLRYFPKQCNAFPKSLTIVLTIGPTKPSRQLGVEAATRFSPTLEN